MFRFIGIYAIIMAEIAEIPVKREINIPQPYDFYDIGFNPLATQEEISYR